MTILDNFGTNDESNPISILKDLINPKDIEMKSDITSKKLGVIMDIYWNYLINKKEFRNKNSQDLLWNEFVPYLLKLSVSLNRNSRKESIEGISKINERLIEQDYILRGLIDKK